MTVRPSLKLSEGVFLRKKTSRVVCLELDGRGERVIYNIRGMYNNNIGKEGLMERHQEVTAEEFLELVAIKKPAEAFYRRTIGSFDWVTCKVCFSDGGTEFQVIFGHSDHATPDIPSALLYMIQHAEIEDRSAACDFRRIVRPAELLQSGG